MLQRYRSHKIVQAGKILQIQSASPFAGAAGYSELTVQEAPDSDYKVIYTMTPGWMLSHRPQAGGYLVVYDNDYQSFSPAEAFESGYTAISDGAEPAQTAQDSSYRAKDCQYEAEIVSLREQLRMSNGYIADQKQQIHRGIEREQALKAQLDAVRKCNDTLQDTVSNLQDELFRALHKIDDVPTAEEEEAFDALQSARDRYNAKIASGELTTSAADANAPENVALANLTPIPAAELSGEFEPPQGIFAIQPPPVIEQPQLDERLAALERRLNMNISEAIAHVAKRLTALEDDGE